MSDEHEKTLPAPHPETPEWALSHYNLMLRTYQELVESSRNGDSALIAIRAEVADHEKRLKRLEGGNGSPQPWANEDTNPGGE